MQQWVFHVLLLRVRCCCQCRETLLRVTDRPPGFPCVFFASPPHGTDGRADRHQTVASELSARRSQRQYSIDWHQAVLTICRRRRSLAGLCSEYRCRDEPKTRRPCSSFSPRSWGTRNRAVFGRRCLRDHVLVCRLFLLLFSRGWRLSLEPEYFRCPT